MNSDLKVPASVFDAALSDTLNADELTEAFLRQADGTKVLFAVHGVYFPINAVELAAINGESTMLLKYISDEEPQEYEQNQQE